MSRSLQGLVVLAVAGGVGYWLGSRKCKVSR